MYLNPHQVLDKAVTSREMNTVILPESYNSDYTSSWPY